jgi:hypothetical protein
VLFAKFGIEMCFNSVYVSNSMLFPVLFAATAMGYCNTIARLFSAGSSVVAFLEEPTPIVIFTVLSAIAGILVVALRVPDDPNLLEVTPEEL